MDKSYKKLIKKEKALESDTKKVLEKDNSKIGSFGLGSSRIILDPLLNHTPVLVRPIINILRVSGICIYPSLRQAVVCVCPLRDQVRLSHVAVLLKPRFDIRGDQLPAFGATVVLHDRTERVGYPISKDIIRCS